MSQTSRITALALAVVFLAGCPAKPVVEEDAEADRDAQQEAAAAAAAAAREAEIRRAREEEALRADPLRDPDSILAQRTIYFDFDRSDVKPEFMEIVKAHADYLVDNQRTVVTLEGHTDERGSREYNIGLGNRRAQAVRRMLMLHGVADRQITPVSYGEEKPVALGQNEAAWARNRRVEFVYSR